MRTKQMYQLFAALLVCLIGLTLDKTNNKNMCFTYKFAMHTKNKKNYLSLNKYFEWKKRRYINRDTISKQHIIQRYFVNFFKHAVQLLLHSAGPSGCRRKFITLLQIVRLFNKIKKVLGQFDLFHTYISEFLSFSTINSSNEQHFFSTRISFNGLWTVKFRILYRKQF